MFDNLFESGQRRDIFREVARRLYQSKNGRAELLRQLNDTDSDDALKSCIGWLPIAVAKELFYRACKSGQARYMEFFIDVSGLRGGENLLPAFVRGLGNVSPETQTKMMTLMVQKTRYDRAFFKELLIAVAKHGSKEQFRFFYNQLGRMGREQVLALNTELFKAAAYQCNARVVRVMTRDNIPTNYVEDVLANMYELNECEEVSVDIVRALLDAGRVEPNLQDCKFLKDVIVEGTPVVLEEVCRRQRVDKRFENEDMSALEYGAFEAGVEQDKFDILVHYTPDEDVLAVYNRAADFVNRDVLQMFTACEFVEQRIHNQVFNTAVKVDNAECVAFFIDAWGLENHARLIRRACKKGLLKILEYLADTLHIGIDVLAVRQAVRNNQIKVLRWLVDKEHIRFEGDQITDIMGEIQSAEAARILLGATYHGEPVWTEERLRKIKNAHTYDADVMAAFDSAIRALRSTPGGSNESEQKRVKDYIKPL